MKKQTSIIFGALIGAILLLSGCSKGTFNFNKGGQVSFGASSGGSATKTEYGDDFTNSGVKYQAIDWSTGDLVRITSDVAAVYNDGSGLTFSDYKVTSVTSNNGASEATVENAKPNGLAWKDGYTGTYNFWAVYPATSDEAGFSFTTAVGADQGKVTLPISATPALPTTTDTKYVGEDGKPVESAEGAALSYTVYKPDMTKAWMTASAADVKESDNKPQVQLHFKPAFTAFEFNISSEENQAIEIVKIELEALGADDYLAGSFSMVAGNPVSTAGNVTVGANPSKTITLNTVTGEGDDAKGVMITPATESAPANGATFTLFSLPKDNAGIVMLKVTIKDGEGTKLARLKMTYADGGKDLENSSTTHAKGEPVVFKAGKKYRINMLKLPNRFNFAVIDLTGKAIEWTDVPCLVDNKNYPEATQFEVEGVNNGRYNTDATQDGHLLGRDAKQFRQYWLLDADHPATVKFKVMSPIGYDWLVVPQGDVDYYTITSNVNAENYTAGGLRGPINTVDGTASTTNVILYVSAKTATDTAEHSLYFKTYVISRDNKVQYSLDTETQLVDFRGYHYFILNNSSIVE